MFCITRVYVLVLLGFLGGLLPRFATASDEVLNTPQRLLVMSREARLMRGDEASGSVPQGTVLTVNRANANWRYSPDNKGWVHLRDTIPLERAEAELESRIRTDPSATNYQLRGIARMAADQWASAAQDFEKAYDLGESSTNLHYNLGVCYERLGEYAAALEEFDSVLSSFPDEFPSLLARANLLLNRSQTSEALRDLDKAVSLKPDSADAHNSRGIALRMLNRFAEAIAAYDKAIELNPEREDAICNRGYVKKQLRQEEAAKEDYEVALKLAPTSNSIRNDLAWLLATSTKESIRDPKRSLELSEAVCKETQFKDPDYLDTLAAAYARNERFAAAIETAKLALSLVKEEADAAPIRQRLSEYEQNRAVIDSVTASVTDSGAAADSTSSKSD